MILLHNIFIYVSNTETFLLVLVGHRSLKVSCVVYFELKNINRKKNFVKIRSYLCNGFVMFFFKLKIMEEILISFLFSLHVSSLIQSTTSRSAFFSGKTNTNLTYSDSIDHKSAFLGLQYKHTMKSEVLPRFELGSLDSKSKVLTVTPKNRRAGKNHYFKHSKVLDNDRVREVYLEDDKLYKLYLLRNNKK